MKEERMEPIWVEGNGFRALVESYAVEPRQPAHPAGVPQALGCLALAGGRDAVRAILAHALTRGQLDLVGPAGTIRAWLGHEPAGWALRLAALAGAGAGGARRGGRATHGLVVPKSALRLDDPPAADRFTLVVPPDGPDWPEWDAATPLVPPPDGARVYAAFGRQLQARAALPLHPAWMPSLWRELAAARQIQRLIGRGPQVFRCLVPADRLAELVRAGCAGGELPALIAADGPADDVPPNAEEGEA
jgi:hypothetical protein